MSAIAPPEATSDRVLLLVVAERLSDVQATQTAIQAQLTTMSSSFVPRGEWVLRNAHVDGMFVSQGREIGDLRSELRSRRLPWPTVVSALVSIAALLVALGVLGS